LKRVIEGYEGAKYPHGTGGGFGYLNLNGVLYDYSGYVNPDAHYRTWQHISTLQKQKLSRLVNH